MNCSICGTDAVIFIRYNGNRLCASHFKDYVEKRVKNELRRELGRVRSEEHIVAAVSGGKDSMVMLHLLRNTYKMHRNITLSALTIDEGIEGYRPQSIEKVRTYCREFDIPLKVVKFEECNCIPIDQASELRGDMTQCAICGVFRRNCMNTTARRMEATRLSTGHNLDDTAQTILMNLTRGDLQRMVRMGPHSIIKPGLIPRIQPLRQIPEKESYLYAVLSGIDFHDGECPYFNFAQRNIYRHVVEELEERMPGTRHSIVRTYDQLYEPLMSLYPDVTVNQCERCGEPTSGILCKTCETVDMLKANMKKNSEKIGSRNSNPAKCDSVKYRL